MVADNFRAKGSGKLDNFGFGLIMLAVCGPSKGAFQEPQVPHSLATAEFVEFGPGENDSQRNSDLSHRHGIGHGSLQHNLTYVITLAGTDKRKSPVPI